MAIRTRVAPHSPFLALAATAALALTLGACSSSSPGQTTGTGGSSSSGGSTGSGGGNSSTGGSGQSCTNVTACSGNVVGTWTVNSSCLTVSGMADASGLGVGCTSVGVSGSLHVTGSVTLKSDGSYVDNTTTTGTEQLTLAAACLTISGTTTTCTGITGPLSALGFESVTCTSASGGGCNCTGTVNQTGGLGYVSVNASSSGAYTSMSNTLTYDGLMKYSTCASGNTLTVTPQAPNTSGTVVLQGNGSSGTGGTVGSGGSTGAGGSTGGGGKGGSGGSAATGGSGGRGSGGAAGGRGGSAGAGSGGTPATGGSTGSGGTSGGTVMGPCDIYAAASTPCGAAYSTIRVLSSKYTGPLYQVRNGSSAMNTGSGGMTKDIGAGADGFADTATQDTFCSGTTCTISVLYDQSGNKNDLKAAPAGLTNGGSYAAMPDFESSATKGMLTVNGHKVYSLYMNTREGYRTPLNVKATGVPMGNTAQGIYELADGTHSGSACCWDFGSVSPDPTKYVTMNTLFFGTATFWDTGAGSGPWFMGDFEGGVWAGGSASGTGNKNNSNPSLKVQFALGILHTPVGKYALRMADIKTATDLTTAYDGNIPSGKTWGNAGGIVLGVGGDNSNNSYGTFYEGAVVNGSPSNATDLAVMQNIQAAGYGK